MQFDQESVTRVRELIAYLWDKELSDARENGPEGQIFGTLVALDNLIEGRTRTVADYLNEPES